MSLVAWQSAPRPGPGPEPEPCWRVRPQARRYLEQLRARLAPGPAGPAGPAPADYLVEAAAHLRLALERDAGEDYEAAFNHYQNSVDVLLRGVHVDPNKERCEAVKLKISKYLRRAEEIFTYHLDEGSGTGLSSLRLRPIRTLSSALEQLRSCRVIGVLGKVQLVRDPDSGGTFVVKSLPRSPEASRERLTIIPRGVPYMTKLLRYFVSEDSIFLHLEHVPGGPLWSRLCPPRPGLRRHLEELKAPQRPAAPLTPRPPAWPGLAPRGPPAAPRPSWGPPWVRAGAGRVLGARAPAEEQVRLWAAQVLLALAGLHEQGLLCRDLNPRNLLLDQAGQLRLTFFSQWAEVEPQCCREAADKLYCAPGKWGLGPGLCGSAWE
ncbi:ribosomal protein S6 kinase-like 1 isoform X1 [Erinaceus europaeus]|uniref:Ribosomal protein S6 kinase-like 1 isoform X1 n=1 Tax=Erinaceus europaeus TaxID=9365 RepID=A0ABM3WL06_ERIEU|nr:ribosomal protein S6 kinase-like 1 isoform X1 [Erinaceus europaeus]